MRKPGTFFAACDFTGQPSVRLVDAPINGCEMTRHFKTCITWPGAYFAAIWRNLLGPHYHPFSPSLRRDLNWAKRAR